MDLIKRTALLTAAFLTASSGLLIAAPKLRLSNTVVGPVWVSPGAAAATQTVELYNAGDGSLSPTVSSNASWAVPSVGAAHACPAATGISGNCIPVTIALGTDALAAGTYGAVITVADTNSNAVDAPQDIHVAVRVGNALDLYVAPGSSRTVEFVPSARVNAAISVQSGSGWLTLDGNGTMNYTGRYGVRLTAASGMAEGNYNGQIAFTGAAVDTRTTPVTMRVTGQPVAVAAAYSAVTGASESFWARVAQGAPAIARGISINNAGSGTLTVSSARITTPITGLTLQQYGNYLQLTMEPPASMAAGNYTTTIEVSSNAINSTLVVPVTIQVVAKGAPLANKGGATDAASYTAPVARGTFVSLYGEQLLFAAPVTASTVPLPTVSNSVSVLVNGQAAPLSYLSYGQINFQMPVDAPLGINTVQVKRDDVLGNPISVEVVERAASIIPIGNYAAAVNASDASLPMPAGALPGWPYGTHPAKPGDVLTIYCLGLGSTVANVASGAAAPSSPLPWVTDVPTAVIFGVSPFGIAATPVYAGLSPGSVGLYQVNVVVPQGLGSGDIYVHLSYYNGTVSNSLKVAVQQ